MTRNGSRLPAPEVHRATSIGGKGLSLAIAVVDRSFSSKNRLEDSMAQRKTLTEQQVVVLRWVGDGCPDGVMPDLSHRVSTAALDKRGLVEVIGKRDTWSAKITKEGQEYLDAVDGPNPPIPRQANLSVTEQLVQDVIDAGGALRVPRKRYYDKDAIDYERRARLAEAHGKVPSGKWLICVSADEQLELRLIDATTEAGEEADPLVPLEIPERVGRYHPAARRFRDAKARHEVSRAQLPRMVKVAHVVAKEAERRGWKVKVPPAQSGEFGDHNWSPGQDGHMRLEIGQREYGLRFREQGVKLRGPWDEEVKRWRESAYFYRDKPEGNYDSDATGELRIELIDQNRWQRSGRQAQWADRKSWSMEERLPHLFRELEGRLVDADRLEEQARVAAEEKAERERKAAESRRIEWEHHIENARAQLLEQQRAEILRKQAARWREANDLRAYRDEIEARYGDVQETRRWIEWIDEFIDKLDPLTSPPTLPSAPEESVDALQPFMPKGWSAEDPELRYDPNRGHSRPYRHGW